MMLPSVKHIMLNVVVQVFHNGDGQKRELAAAEENALHCREILSFPTNQAR